MIYIDPPHTSPDYRMLRREITTFVTADSVEELLRFGDRLGWDNEKYLVYPEVWKLVAYDISTSMRLEALRAGARECPAGEAEARAKRLLPEWEELL